MKEPRLRFKRFKDKWKNVQLTNIAKILNGLTYSPKDIRNSGTFVIRSSNIQNGRIVNADNVYVNSIVVNSENVKKNDVIVVVRNGSKNLIGKHANVNNSMNNTVIGAFMSILRSDNGLFLNCLLSTDKFKKEVHRSLGSTINQITKKDFSIMKFEIPSSNEQKKIGSFFEKLDQLIQLQSNKLEHLKEIKKGYLQKMFSYDKYKKNPKLRFNNFYNNWEEKILKDLGTIQSGYGFPEKEQNGKVGIPFFKVSDMVNNLNIMKTSNNYVNANQIKKNNWKVIYPKNKSVIFAKVEAALKKNRKRIVDIPFLTDNNIMSYSFDDSWNSSFGIVLFNTLYLPKYAQVGALPSFNAYDIEKIKIIIPKLPEQQKIGKFFSNLDKQINIQQQKLDNLKQQKKAYLQKMFI